MELNRRHLLATTAAAAAALTTPAAAAAADTIPGPSTPTIPQTGDLIFASRFNEGTLAPYKNFHPAGMVIGRDIGLQKDPTGGGRVAWLDSRAGLTHGNEHGRASLEAPARFYPTAHGNTNPVYAHWTRLWFPKEHAFTTTSHWCAFMGVHGYPWVTGSATGLMLVFNPNTGNHYLRMGNDPTILKEQDTTIPLGAWVDVIQYFNYNYQKDGGWARLFLAFSGRGYNEIPIRGTTGGRRMNTITDTEGSGWYHNPATPAATARVGIYGNHPMRILLAHHRVSRTLTPLIGTRTINRKPLSALTGLR